MKYYFCTITELNGEAEYPSKFLMKSDNIEPELQAVFKDYRGEGDYDDFLTGYEKDFVWFGSLAAKDPYYTEIPESDFNVLKKYLTVL